MEFYSFTGRYFKKQSYETCQCISHKNVKSSVPLFVKACFLMIMRTFNLFSFHFSLDQEEQNHISSPTLEAVGTGILLICVEGF